MNKEELETRQLVWEAMSYFYLDTELDEKEYEYISKVIIQSGYSLEECKQIDLYEVFPTLQMNLLSVAGEWAGFNDSWLKEKCYGNFKKRNNKSFRFWTRIMNKFCYWMRKEHWNEIEKIIKSTS